MAPDGDEFSSEPGPDDEKSVGSGGDWFTSVDGVAIATILLALASRSGTGVRSGASRCGGQAATRRRAPWANATTPSALTPAVSTGTTPRR